MKGKDEFQFRLIFGEGLLTIRQLKRLGEKFQDTPIKIINTKQHPWQEMGVLPLRDIIKKF